MGKHCDPFGLCDRYVFYRLCYAGVSLQRAGDLVKILFLQG